MSNDFLNHQRNSSRTRGHVDVNERENYEEIPEEFFCRISKNFMWDPVNIPKSHYTYDRDSVRHLYRGEDVLPDLRMRRRMDEWFSHYELAPAFDFIYSRDDLVAALNSVAKHRNVCVLREFAKSIIQRPWLMENGGGMLCVATLLSCPHPSASWVATTLPIVAHVDDDSYLLPVPADIHPEYSILHTLSRVCKPQNDRFRMGFINFLHALLMNCPDISVMSGKLKGITELLVSYVLPVPNHELGQKCFQRAMATLERISRIEECCQLMGDAGIVWTIFVVLRFAVYYLENVGESGDFREAAFVGIEKSMLILDKVFSCCAQPRDQIEQIVHLEPELDLISKALGYVGVIEAYEAGIRVLPYLGGDPFNVRNLPQ